MLAELVVGLTHSCHLLRSADDDQAERQRRQGELTITGNRAEARVLREWLSEATGVTIVGDTALVLYERARAAVVPHRP
jgi:hypothetical protein